MKKYVDMNILFSHVTRGREAYMQDGQLLHRYGTFTYFCFNPQILTRLLRGGEFKDKAYIDKYEKATQDSKVLSKSIHGTQKSQAKGLGNPQYRSGLGSPAKDPSVINPSVNNHEFIINNLKYSLSEEGWIKHEWNGNIYRMHDEPDEEAKIYALKHFGIYGAYKG